MKDKFYPSPSNLLEIVRTYFGVIMCQDFASPSLKKSGHLTGCGENIEIVRDFGDKLCSKKCRLCGIAQCCDQQKSSLSSHENDNFASISDKIKNALYQSSTTSFRKALNESFAR